MEGDATSLSRKATRLLEELLSAYQLDKNARGKSFLILLSSLLLLFSSLLLPSTSTSLLLSFPSCSSFLSFSSLSTLVFLLFFSSLLLSSASASLLLFSPLMLLFSCSVLFSFPISYPFLVGWYFPVNSLSSAEAKILSHGLRNNTTLKILDLSGNKIGMMMTSS